MNDTFSAKRFALLVRKTIAEKPMQSVGLIALLLVLSLALYAIARRLIGFGAAQNLTFIWGLAGGGFFLASFMFAYFGTNANGSSYLTLPASYFEKWLYAILMMSIIYPILFLSFFHLIDYVFVAAFHNSLDPTSPFYKRSYDSVFTHDLTDLQSWKVYRLYFFLVGTMLTGGLYFNKLPFLKTVTAVCVITFAVIGINWLIANTMFPQVVETGPYDHVELMVGSQRGMLILPTNMEKAFLYGSYALMAALWLLPLTRVREKEF